MRPPVIPAVKRLMAVATVLSSAGAARATDLPMDTVVLGALDKVSSRVTTIRGPVGQMFAFGSLQIVARTCLTHPPEERPENSAFLEISQIQAQGKPQQAKLVYSGWMYSSSPAVAAMEHPVYDVWVLSCEAAKKDSTSR